MKMQLLPTIAALAVFGCTSGTPVEKRAVPSGKYIIMSFHLMLFYIASIPVHAAQLLIDSDACLDKLYIMAFTSGITNAQSPDDDPHGVEILAAGHVRHLKFYNLPGDDYSRNKGDLWEYNIASLEFPFSCLTICKIKRVYIIEGSDDAWNIDSIVILAGADGNSQVLTQDLDVNRWIEEGDNQTLSRFELTFAERDCTRISCLVRN